MNMFLSCILNIDFVFLGTESLNKKTLKVSASSIDDNLMQSVQSFANYIQQQFTVNSNYIKDHPEVMFNYMQKDFEKLNECEINLKVK